MSAQAPMVAQGAAGGTLIITGSHPANTAVGDRINCNLQYDASLSAAQFLIIPDSEFWMLVDLYCNSATEAGTTNDTIEFYKDQDRVLDRSRPLLTTLVTSAQRPNGLNTNIGYQGGSHMTVKAVALVASSAAETIKCYAPYEKHV